MSTPQISKTCCEKNGSLLAPDTNRHVLPLKHIGYFEFSVSRNWGRYSLPLRFSYSFLYRDIWPAKQSSSTILSGEAPRIPEPSSHMPVFWTVFRVKLVNALTAFASLFTPHYTALTLGKSYSPRSRLRSEGVTFLACRRDPKLFAVIHPLLARCQAGSSHWPMVIWLTKKECKKKMWRPLPSEVSKGKPKGRVRSSDKNKRQPSRENFSIKTERRADLDLTASPSTSTSVNKEKSEAMVLDEPCVSGKRSKRRCFPLLNNNNNNGHQNRKQRNRVKRALISKRQQ